MKRSTTWCTLLILPLAFLMLGCQAESSPTAPPIPPPGGGPGPAPTQQPTITLTVSNPNPLVNSTSVITANVTIDNAPAPQGTAVEFATNFGSFVENNGQSLLRITNNGAATATLTSAVAGTANVIVRVGNVTRTTTVVFRAEDTQPPPSETAPSVTSLSPTKGFPSGGTLVTITGKNFQQPVRVLFGDRPGNVLSVTSTQIQVVAPAIDLLPSEQQRVVDVQVISQAGTPDEKSANSPTKFTYELQILTPEATAVLPFSGPNEGNTRITIFGGGFQPPTKLYFSAGGGAVELEVLSVTFSQIVAMTPPALGLGTDLRNQTVSLRILNVLSGKEVTLSNAFRYGPDMVITSVEPLSGSSLGGDRITINGWGFDDPVAITFGGIPAQPVSVSGTKIVVVTAPLLSPCAGGAASIIVRNVEDGGVEIWGDAPEEPMFQFLGTLPTIIGVTPNPAVPGQAVTVTVRNPGVGTIRFVVGGNTVIPTPNTSTQSTGDVDFVITAPDVTFQTEPCTDPTGRAGTRFVPAVVPITFNNVTTGCSDTLTGALTINPPDLSCRVPPEAITPTATVAFTGTCGGPSTPDQPFLVSNAGGTDLIINGVNSSLPNFQVISPALPVTVPPGGAVTFMLRINPLPPIPPATPQQGTISVVSNDPTPPTATPATMTCTP